MTWKSVAGLIALVSAITASTIPLGAQAVQTSTLTGTVRDGTGAVLPGPKCLRPWRPTASLV